MIHPSRNLFVAHRIHTNPTTYACRRCGITITYERSYLYQDTCRDCAPYLGITRKKAA